MCSYRGRLKYPSYNPGSEENAPANAALEIFSDSVIIGTLPVDQMGTFVLPRQSWSKDGRDFGLVVSQPEGVVITSTLILDSQRLGHTHLAPVLTTECFSLISNIL